MRSLSFKEKQSDDVLRKQIVLRGVARSTIALWGRQTLLDHIATMMHSGEW